MAGSTRPGPGTWRLNLQVLRVVAILLPILFLILVDVLRHVVFPVQLHTFTGFLATHTVLAIAVISFAHLIFSSISRLQTAVAERNRQLTALNNIARAAAEKLSLNDLLSASLDHVLPAMKADAGLICLLDQEQQEHSAVSSRGFAEETVRRIQKAKIRDDPVASQVVQTGRPVFRENLLEDPRVRQATQTERIASFVNTPLKSEGEVNGMLVVASKSPRHFSASDKEFLEGIGGQLGIAIHNAVLYEVTQRRNRDLGALLAVGRVVTSSLNMEDVLLKSLDTILQVTAIDAAEVWLLEDQEELVLKCHRGASQEAFLERTRFRIGEGLPGLAAQKQEPVVVHDLPADTRFLRQQVVKAGFRTFCALPLQHQGRVTGVLAVASFSADTLNREADLSLLMGIGESLTVAIENARLHQQVQDLAVLQERERIAREMHDGMAQLLGYINTQTLAVKKFISDKHLSEAQNELTKMEEIARDLYADVREGILGLRTASFQGRQLLQALEEYLDRFEDMSGIKCAIQIAPQVDNVPLPLASEIQLMRIVQEALSNVRKHAKASTVSLVLSRKGTTLEVRVVDNGEGFDPARVTAAGWPKFGLQTMRERAESVGGTFTIESAPGRGTQVIVAIPLPAEEAAAATP